MKKIIILLTLTLSLTLLFSGCANLPFFGGNKKTLTVTLAPNAPQTKMYLNNQVVQIVNAKSSSSVTYHVSASPGSSYGVQTVLMDQNTQFIGTLNQNMYVNVSQYGQVTQHN